MKPYSVFAKYYDKLISDVDYAARARYIASFLPDGRDRLVIDLGCGTGSLTVQLAGMGYSMIGIDLSEDMLAVAADKLKGSGALLLRQDASRFELYGTVSAVVSCLDCMNYLDRKQIAGCFACVANYLDPGGVFVFDINSPWKLKNVLGDNVFCYDVGDVYCVWQNTYTNRGHVRFDLTFFERLPGGLYRRSDEVHREYVHTIPYLTGELRRAGLTLKGVYGDMSMNAPAANEHRIFFVAEKPRS